ncbi:MAG: NADH-quinone oxidoreductase subunit M [Candidatus Gastranaerophilales bacterium]|nr:NADH-quinone oxidoreductase subunit M [Candidatus Gastranaerophilales bacterium]
MQHLSVLILIFSPLIMSAILFTPFFKNNEVRIRRFSKGFASLHFLYSLLFLVFFNPLNQGISYYEEIKFFGTSWIQPLGFKMAFGLDGISLLMVILTSFIFLLALIASKSNIRQKHKFYYSMIFLLQTAVLGVFCARDMFLFFMFWELELVPMYFLIGQWGGGNCKASAMKFVLYTFLGSLSMLLGMLLLYFYNFSTYGTMTADFSAISVSSPEFPIFLQVFISILLLIGFAVKMPIVPLHTWLPDAHTDAPTPVSMILAAILLKMGAFGVIRFNMQLLPEGFQYLVPLLLIFALINIIYTAFVAYAQMDLKKIVAYSSISNMGIVLLGLCTLNLIGFSGAVFQMVAHGIISAGLFMLVGIIYIRTKTREIADLGGLGDVMPRLMGFGIILSLASVGLPLLIGFVGEFLVFLGAFNSPVDELSAPIKIYSVIAISVLVLSAAYILRLLHKTFFANIFEKWSKINDITNHEFVVLFALILAVAFFGVFPMSILDIIQPILANILEIFKI